MTEIRRGLHYRFVFEGVANDLRQLVTPSGKLVDAADAVAVEELAPPLPSGPGSVLLDKAGRAWQLGEDEPARWRDSTGGQLSAEDMRAHGVAEVLRDTTSRGER
ncbi:hypothetical protein GTR02_21425 [Kineococcus sp. R8]|uniref:hypothetical protein n=1 Tax=Kineococcus siccus TaxID=2696567 RepID=UPI001412096F|nr:hypothetical protein [Kineococcus siccus]NAZ84367.1 hypothetical protein [Kineococcus siccus]